MTEDDIRGKSLLQSLKGGLALGGPHEGSVFTRKLGQGTGYLTIAVNKSPVEVGEA